MQTLPVFALCYTGPPTVTRSFNRYFCFGPKNVKRNCKKKKKKKAQAPGRARRWPVLETSWHGRLCFDREVAPCFISPGGGKPNIDASPGSRSMGGCLHCGCSTTALKPRNQRKGTQRQRLITGHCPRLTIILWLASCARGLE